MAKAKKAANVPDMFNEGEIPPMPTALAQSGFDMWVEFAKKNKWVVPVDLDSGYRTAFKRAIPDYGGLPKMRRILEMMEKDDFFMGRVPPTGTYSKPFKANLTWFLRPVTVRMLKEKMHNVEEPVAASVMQGHTTGRSWRTILMRYKPRGFWAGSDGPRPEEAGCTVPAEFLDPWRKEHGITGVRGQVTAETREQKLAASIVSYRNIGRYDDANRLEEQLAKLENRPAVLVPAGDVAYMTSTTAKPPPVPNSPPPRPRQEAVDVEEIPPWTGDIPEGDESQAEP